MHGELSRLMKKMTFLCFIHLIHITRTLWEGIYLEEVMIHTLAFVLGNNLFVALESRLRGQIGSSCFLFYQSIFIRPEHACIHLTNKHLLSASYVNERWTLYSCGPLPSKGDGCRNNNERIGLFLILSGFKISSAGQIGQKFKWLKCTTNKSGNHDWLYGVIRGKSYKF